MSELRGKMLCEPIKVVNLTDLWNAIIVIIVIAYTVKGI
jgi:hypothetical protein